MFTHRVSNFIKLFIGIVVLEGISVLLTYTALRSDIATTWPLFVAVGASIGVLVTLWFESISGGTRVQAIAQMQQRHAQEREKIRLQAERDKARLEVKNTKTKGSSGGKLRTGIAVGGIVGVGIAMVLAQFVTLGLLTLSTVGGAALGYTVRARQEKRLRLRGDDLADQALITRSMGKLSAQDSLPAKRLLPSE